MINGGLIDVAPVSPRAAEGLAVPFPPRREITLGHPGKRLLVHPFRRPSKPAPVGVADDHAAKTFIGPVESADVLVVLIAARFSGYPGAHIHGEPVSGAVLVHQLCRRPASGGQEAS